MKIYTKQTIKHEIDGAIFELKPLSTKKAFELQDVMEITQPKDGSAGKIANFSTYIYKVVLNSLVGWEGVEDENGKPVAFPKKVEDALEMLDEITITKLGFATQEASKLKDAEEKN